MECSEKVLSGTGEMELDPNIVSEEAGKLYSELQVKQLLKLFFHSIPLLLKRNGIIIYMWAHILYLASHAAALPYHRQLLRLMVKVWWSHWYPYLFGSWRGWPAAKPS